MPTLNQLRELLREQGQPTSGTKAILTARWNNWTKLAGDLEDAELPIEGSLEEMEKRLLTPYTPTGDGSGLVVQTKTCPNRTDPLRGEILKPGTKIHQLRNTNGSMSKCYTDRTMKMFTETSLEAVDGPFQEDMGSFSYPYSVEGHGDVVVRRRWDSTNHVLLPFSACKGNQDIIGAYVRADAIPYRAFAGCIELKYVNLPSTLKTIATDAFRECTFASLVLPAGLEKFGHQRLFRVTYVTFLGLPEGKNVLRLPDDSIPAAVHIAVFIGGEVLRNFFWENIVRAGQIRFDMQVRSKVCRMVIAALDDVNTVDDGATPLWAASATNKIEVVKLLLEAGDDVNNASTDNGATALYAASWNGHDEVVKILLGAGADVNKARTDGGATPLLIASQRGRTKVIEMLLQAGADVNKATTDHGATPLYVASQERRTEVVKMLLGAGADVNKAMTTDGSTPLFIASQKGHLEVVEMLLAAGADVNKARGSGGTPLWVATFYHDFDIAKMLLDAGADMHVPDHKPQGTTAFKLAMAMGGKMERLFMSYVPPPPPN